MKLYKTTQGIIIEKDGNFYLSDAQNWDVYVNRDNLFEEISTEVQQLTNIDWDFTGIVAPINQQEIWASGVTYMRSREARMDESKDSGGADFYARVYEAERPELFFKSSAARCVGTGEKVRIRKDSKWNVPEPELTLFATSSGKIVGYTVGNDMSSRDIEGENPLYLPQAKSYDKAAAIGPCLYVPKDKIDANTQISIAIVRENNTVFEGNISINRIKRSFDELVGYLFREMSFPHGAYLMTGTGIVPDNNFTLLAGDVVNITIEGIGTLSNEVA
ncbi:MAG: fumarylacetoacetate hydrolase family protein [Arcicella sp.]|jgi:2-dehydro-3-deoxy-D-arabinonate dehydratase|nr:fumarylacetoacetate hydrolase family protein [Arcicella sp.]